MYILPKFVLYLFFLPFIFLIIRLVQCCYPTRMKRTNHPDSPFSSWSLGLLGWNLLFFICSFVFASFYWILLYFARTPSMFSCFSFVFVGFCWFLIYFLLYIAMYWYILVFVGISRIYFLYFLVFGIYWYILVFVGIFFAIFSAIYW